MRLKEWAKAAGTCRLMWQLDLDTLDIQTEDLDFDQGEMMQTSHELLHEQAASLD